MEIVAYIKSLFTDEPQPFNHSRWYFRKGKKVSEYQLFLEKHMKEVNKIRDRIINKPNIYAK